MPADRIWHHQLDVVGLGFRVKKETRRLIAEMIDKKGAISGMQLIREPDNPADEYAIKVCMPERIMHGFQIGYLRRPSVELLSPKIDRGTLVIVRARLIELRADDDYKEGALDVTFKDVKVAARAAKSKSS
jgi:hypothetical protein